MFYTYVIQSLKTGKFYIGSCQDFRERLKRHNGGRVKITKNGIPWRLVYLEKFSSRDAAYRKERQIKSYKGGNAFKKLILRWDGRVV